VQVHREGKAIEQAGAALAFVGNGGRHFARAFADELGLEAPVYVDTSLRAYRTLGMKRGVLTALASPSVVASTARALRGGFRQRGVQGDAWQLGGVFVIAPGGKIRYAYASSAAGDHPPVEAILAGVRTRPVGAVSG
jgi:AhpC/TSA antioxidant enzyme